MMVTQESREILRELIDEIIPLGGTDADTRFLEMQIDAMLVAAGDINAAAATGWRLKAARAMSERGGLEESKAGDEQHKFVSLEVYRDHCLAMAKMHNDMARDAGSRLLGYCLPAMPGVET